MDQAIITDYPNPLALSTFPVCCSWALIDVEGEYLYVGAARKGSKWNPRQLPHDIAYGKGTILRLYTFATFEEAKKYRELLHATHTPRFNARHRGRRPGSKNRDHKPRHSRGFSIPPPPDGIGNLLIAGDEYRYSAPICDTDIIPHLENAPAYNDDICGDCPDFGRGCQECNKIKIKN